MKKIIVIISVILIVVALVSAAVFVSSAEELTVIASGICGDQGDNVKWSLDDTGTLTITGNGAMNNYSHSSGTPWYKNIDDITDIVVKDGVTSIGNWAFANCTYLKTISLPNSLTMVCEAAFFRVVG